MTTVLFWDIDGTLLTTARAGIFAWEEAYEEVLGRELDMSGYRTAGLTDAEIALTLADGDARRRAPRCCAATRSCCPSACTGARATCCPNVRENLDALAARDDVVNMLLTGNVEGGAEAKLRHYGLWDYFAETGGAFSVEGSDRPSIARARPRAARTALRRRAHVRDRRHAARRLLRQGDRRAHAGGRHRTRLRPRGAARVRPVAGRRDAPAAARARAAPRAVSDALDRPAAGGRALRGGTVRTVGYLVGMGLLAATAPLLVRHLGLVEFGRYVTILTIVTLAGGLTELGINQLALRELSAEATRSGATTCCGCCTGSGCCPGPSRCTVAVARVRARGLRRARCWPAPPSPASGC